jgi:hypothetical protein
MNLSLPSSLISQLPATQPILLDGPQSWLKGADLGLLDWLFNQPILMNNESSLSPIL